MQLTLTSKSLLRAVAARQVDKKLQNAAVFAKHTHTPTHTHTHTIALRAARDTNTLEQLHVLTETHTYIDADTPAYR